MKKFHAIGLGFLASLLAASAGTVYYVSNAGGDDTNSGLGWEQAFKTISNGVAQAAAGDLVLVTNGTYAISTEITLNKGVCVRGVPVDGSVVVDGQDTVRCFNITHADAAVEGLFLTRGNAAPENGGAVLMTSGRLSDCYMVSNSANSGGGIAEVGSGNLTTPTVIENCVIGCNIATNDTTIGGGGGIFLASTRTNVLIQGCVVYGNVATNQLAAGKYGGMGGGLFSYARGMARDCVFSNNIAVAAVAASIHGMS